MIVPITSDQACGGHVWYRIGDLRCACTDCGMVLVAVMNLERNQAYAHTHIDYPSCGEDPEKIEYRSDQHRCGRPLDFDEMVTRISEGWLGAPVRVIRGALRRTEWLYKQKPYENKYHVILEQIEDGLQITTDLEDLDIMYQPQPWRISGISTDPNNHPLFGIDSALQKASSRIQDQLHKDYPIDQRKRSRKNL